MIHRSKSLMNDASKFEPLFFSIIFKVRWTLRHYFGAKIDMSNRRDFGPLIKGWFYITPLCPRTLFGDTLFKSALCACLLSLCTTCKYTPLLLQLHLCCRKTLLNHWKEITYTGADHTPWQSRWSCDGNHLVNWIFVFASVSLKIWKCRRDSLSFVQLDR